jgi:hypothetical protein
MRWLSVVAAGVFFADPPVKGGDVDTVAGHMKLSKPSAVSPSKKTAP